MAQQPVKDTEPTIGRLVSDASRDISGLVSKEIALAKAELKVTVRTGASASRSSRWRRCSPSWP